MKELFTSDTMLSALADILIWGIVLIASYVLCRVQRLKRDIIKNALEDTAKMKKSVKSMTSSITKGSAERRDVRKAFWKFKQRAKNTRSILQVFIFENGDDTDLKLVVSMITTVIDESNDFAKAFNNQSKEEILACLSKTNDQLTKIEEVLTSVTKRKEAEALARI